MIKFCARGHKFTIHESLLKNNPNTLLCNIYMSVQPVDMYDDHIFVDIDPQYIDIILDYYRFGKEYIDKFYLNKDENRYSTHFIMTLQYMGITDCGYTGFPVMVYPLVYDKKNNEDNSYVESKYKYCNIYTSDNNNIVVHIDNTWIDSKLKRILNGMVQEYVIGISENMVNIWIELDNEYINRILSIMRDGLNIYGHIYERINILEHNEKLIFYLRHYGLANDSIEKQLRNRINRYNVSNGGSHLYYDISSNQWKNYFFDQYDNIMLFTKKECDQKKCKISIYSGRYNSLKSLSEESTELHNFFSQYFDKKIDIIIDLDEELVKILTTYVKNYFCGL